MTPSTAGTGAGCRFDILAKQKTQKGTASRLCRTKSAGPLAIAVFCASEPGSRGKAFITFPMKVAESWCFSNWIRFQTFKNRLWHLFYPEKDFSCRWQHSWCFAWKGDLGKDAQKKSTISTQESWGYLYCWEKWQDEEGQSENPVS